MTSTLKEFENLLRANLKLPSIEAKENSSNEHQAEDRIRKDLDLPPVERKEKVVSPGMKESLELKALLVEAQKKIVQDAKESELRVTKSKHTYLFSK